MSSVMGICGGLVGPQIGNVEKVMVFNAFFKGQRSEEHSKTANSYPSLGRFEVEKVRFLM